jgi:hypothetical protein
MAKNPEETNTRVSNALDAALSRAHQQEVEEGAYTVDISEARYIIFSDLHKGARDGADDFRICERTYNAALAYYERLGYTLIVLGDVEELWENTRKNVLKHYDYTIRLEGKFHEAGRYLRFWGNHDDDWSHTDLVASHLVPLMGNKPLKVRESLSVHIQEGGEELGSLFLVHGHQGTLESDAIAPISKFFVRYFWRPIQRVIRYSLNTPAKDWQLRHAHDTALYKWSENQDKMVLISGHTHRPVFKSATHEAQIRQTLKKAEEALEKDPGNPTRLQEVAESAAELEWIIAQNRQEPGDHTPVELKKPSYFNTGCCAFFDGDITGLEIADGEIRLVRWPDDDGAPKAKMLASAPLRDIFAAC